MQKNTRIVAAALRVGELILSVPKPGRHHHVFYAIGKEFGEPAHHADQGFITSEGQFVERIAALQIAKDAGQLIRRSGGAGCNELFSEDVW